MTGPFFFSSRRRHTRCLSDWSSDVCSSDLLYPHRYQCDDHQPGRMTEIAEKFLFECSKISDLLGCGVRIADRSWITNSSYPACPAEALNEEIGRASCRERV